MNMRHRYATDRDIARVMKFWRDHQDDASSATADADSIRTLIRHDPEALLFCEDGDTLVGTVISAWDGWRGSLYRLVVAHEARRRGVARRLVEAGEARLRALGARRMHLVVLRANAGARAAWEALGYVEDTHDTRFTKMLE